MDGFEEKKWFVYVGDRHEGPFSLGDIEVKLQQAVVSGGSYVWAEGMVDWIVMKEVPAFDGLLSRQSQKVSAAAALTDESDEPSATIVVGSEAEAAKQAEEETVTAPAGAETVISPKKMSSVLELVFPDDNKGKPEHWGDVKVDSKPTPPAAPPAAKSSSSSSRKKSRRKRKLRLALQLGTIALVFVGGYIVSSQSVLNRYVSPLLQGSGFQKSISPLAVRYSGAFPFLLDLFSPLPPLPDVSRADTRELAEAAVTPLESGPALAAAFSNDEPSKPILYIGSNLPDGTQFNVTLDGATATLLDRYNAHVTGVVTVQNHFGKSTPLVLAQEAPLPLGNYEIQVVDSGTQKAQFKKAVFLGGKKDSMYAAKLHEFHARIREKTALEVTELKQVMSATESGLALTLKRFEETKKASSHSTQKKNWSKFEKGEWESTIHPMNEAFTKWAPSLTTGEMYLEAIYRQAQQTGEAVIKLNDLQTALIEGKGDRKSQEIQLGEATASLQSTIGVLNTKLEAIEKSATVVSDETLPIRD